jgi:glycosyltransferase involved in cell wall biosynthesis
MPAIHQLSAGFTNHDAISNEARVLRTLFRSWGHASEIFSETRRILPALRKEALDIGGAAATIRPEDVVILHLSIGSPVNAVFRELRCRKAILYHNITPPEYFRGLQEEIAHNLRAGLEQTRALADAAEVVMAVSRFNADELERAGHRNVRVLPLMLDRAAWAETPDRRILRQYDNGMLKVLFVGRGAPNKRIEDLLRVFYYLQNYVERDAMLIHAGSYAGLERYFALLRTRCHELSLRNVVFAGSVPQAELNALYRSAGVFLCMSDHEGFCIPLLEAMAHDVPVVAYAAGAVPETLDGAGVLVREKDFPSMAEMAAAAARPGALRTALLARQRERLAAYTARDLAGELRDCLQPLLA